MSKQQRRVGDNSGNINPIEEAAINFIKSIKDNLIVQKKYCAEAVLGRNKTARDNAAVNSIAQINGVLNKLEPWQKVIEAKEKGADIHAAPIKKHKLAIVTNFNTEKFGQYLIDKEDHDKR